MICSLNASTDWLNVCKENHAIIVKSVLGKEMQIMWGIKGCLMTPLMISAVNLVLNLRMPEWI